MSIKSAIAKLGEVLEGKTYFEHSPSKNPECAKRWLALNDALKTFDADYVPRTEFLCLEQRCEKIEKALRAFPSDLFEPLLRDALRLSAETLADALPHEIERCERLLEHYKEIGPVGAFGFLMIRRDIQAARKAIADGDTVGMIRAFAALKGAQ